jgi:hypothetical protein
MPLKCSIEIFEYHETGINREIEIWAKKMWNCVAK